MMNRYYIIDDFYNNSDELVKFALDSVKEGGMKGNFCWCNDSKFIFGRVSKRNVSKTTARNFHRFVS